MPAPEDDGCYILVLHGGQVLAGMVKTLEVGGVRRVEVDVVETESRRAHLAIIAPESIASSLPCSAEEARGIQTVLGSQGLGEFHGDDVRGADGPQAS